MSVFEIHYIGDDPDFLVAIREFIKAKKINATLKNSMASPIQVCMQDCAQIIYMDFTCTSDAAVYVQQANFLKRIPKYSNLIFIGLFKDEEELKRFSYIFSSGFQFSFIKGGEIFSLLRDSLQIAANGFISSPKFAEAKGLLKKVRSGVCSTIVEINTIGMTLESNLKPKKSNIGIAQSIFPDLDEVEITNNSGVGTRFPLATTFEIGFPLSDPWADDTKKTICSETVETWIDLNRDKFIQKNDNFFVSDPSFSCLHEVFEEELKSCFYAFYFGGIDEIAESVENVRPSILFIEADENDNHPNSMSRLDQLVFQIQKISNYHPILIISNMPSTSTAAQKALNYNSIICYDGKLRGRLMHQLIEKFSHKKLLSKEETSNVFSFSSEMRIADLIIEITIYKMTEHEIVFRCDEDLPLFSVLHLKSPVSLYATLVPTAGNNSEESRFQFKTAVIHGISEKKIESLRKFINALIVNPEMEFIITEDYSEITKLTTERFIK